MPLGKDPSRNMREITNAHPDWSRKRRLAASLNAAREHGARIPGRRRSKTKGRATNAKRKRS